MYSIRKKVKKFDMDDMQEVEELEKVINNPLCTISKKQYMTIEEKTFEKGKLDSIKQKPICIMEWDQKVVLT